MTVCVFTHTATSRCSAEELPEPNTFSTSVQKSDAPVSTSLVRGVSPSAISKASDAPTISPDKPLQAEPKADDAKPKDDKEKPGDAKKSDEAKDVVNTELDVIPPPPAPTPEEVTKRKEKAVEYQSLGEKAFGIPITGSLLNRYRLRHGVGETDQDMSEFITVDVGEKAREMATAHIDARVSEQLDHSRLGNRSDVFTGLLDTYNRPVDARVYSAYIDFNKICGVDYLRVGRQFDYDTPEILEFDGARLDTKPIRELASLDFSFYGGAPVHQFEKTNSGDWLAGMATEVRPTESSKIRLDYIHLNDSFKDSVIPSTDPLLKSLSPNGGTRVNDITSISFWQRFKDPDVRLNGHFSLIDGEARDLSLRTTYNNTCLRLQVSGSYSVWFKPETQAVTEFDQFYETLKGQEPYQNGNITVSKGLLECLWLDVSATSRRLVDNAQAQMFNREFDRFYSTLQTRDLLKKGLKVGVTASRWEGRDHAPTTTQYGGDVSYEWRKHLETVVGTDYELYKYDFFQNTEHDQVRTYYVRQRFKPTRWANLDARYEFEQSRGQNFQTFTMQFRFDF